MDVFGRHCTTQDRRDFEIVAFAGIKQDAQLTHSEHNPGEEKFVPSLLGLQ